VVAAVVVLGGVALVILGSVMQYHATRLPGGMTRLGQEVGAAGIVLGLIVLVLFAVIRRSARKQALNPTSVYSPGGLLDVTRESQEPVGARPPRSTCQALCEAPAPVSRIPMLHSARSRHPWRPPAGGAAAGASTGRQPRQAPVTRHRGLPTSQE
jgi:hypothetical protein